MKILKYWLETVVGILLVVLVFATLLQVIFRFVFTFSAPGLEDIVRIAFSYMVFLCAALGIKYSNHLSVEVLDKLSPRLQFYLVNIGKIITLIFILLFIYYGTIHTINSRTQYTSSLEISNMYLHMALPISGVLMLYYHIKNIITSIRNDKKGEES